MSERAWILPDEPVVVRFMNTIWADRRGAHDDLAAPADLAAWLRAVCGLPANATPSAHDLRQARRLRDACRRIAAHVTAVPPARATNDLDPAVTDVNAMAAMRTPADQLVRHGGRLTRRADLPPRPVSAALATIARDAVERFSDPTLPPLRACLAPGCVLFFVKDHPRREWCSTTCANRVRAARHYRRRQQPHGA